MQFSRRDFLRLGGGAVLLAATGCDLAPEEVRKALSLDGPAPGPWSPPAGGEISLMRHALNRMTFGPSLEEGRRWLGGAGDDEARFEAFIEEQLAPERIDDARCDRAVRRLEVLQEPAGELFEYQPEFLLDQMRRGVLLRALLSRRQLFEVMVDFWTDHLNIDPSKGDCRWLKAADDRDVIRRHALGSFPEMIRASALSPAMLWYLDGRANRRANPSERPNENYARELLELHTLGVHGGYEQFDVMEVARCLTGWTVRSVQAFEKGKVEFLAKFHDQGEKQVLGKQVPAAIGDRDLDKVLDTVALHASTAQHLATKLCRHFIADEPPASAVDAVAKSFLGNRGEIRPVLRTLFHTPEFRAARASKFKRPFHFVVSALRATNATTDAGPWIQDYLVRMGQAPFGCPTPDGYPDVAAPWLGSLLWRWNFAVALAEGRLPKTAIEMESLRHQLGGDSGLMPWLLGRQPTAEEQQAYRESGASLALLLSAPAFQRC